MTDRFQSESRQQAEAEAEMRVKQAQVFSFSSSLIHIFKFYVMNRKHTTTPTTTNNTNVSPQAQAQAEAEKKKAEERVAAQRAAQQEALAKVSFLAKKRKKTRKTIVKFFESQAQEAAKKAQADALAKVCARSITWRNDDDKCELYCNKFEAQAAKQEAEARAKAQVA